MILRVQQNSAGRQNPKPPLLLQLEVDIYRVAACSPHSLRNGGDLDHLAGRLEDRLIHDRITTRLGEPEVADRPISLDRNPEHGGEVVLVLGRDGCRLLPLAEESVVDQRLVGIDRTRVGSVTSGTARPRSAPLGG